MLSEGPSDLFAQQSNGMFYLDILKSFNGPTLAMIFGAVRFQLTHLSCDDCEYIYIFINIIRREE